MYSESFCVTGVLDRFLGGICCNWKGDDLWVSESFCGAGVLDRFLDGVCCSWEDDDLLVNESFCGTDVLDRFLGGVCCNCKGDDLWVSESFCGEASFDVCNGSVSLGEHFAEGFCAPFCACFGVELEGHCAFVLDRFCDGACFSWRGDGFLGVVSSFLDGVSFGVCRGSVTFGEDFNEGLRVSFPVHLGVE